MNLHIVYCLFNDTKIIHILFYGRTGRLKVLSQILRTFSILDTLYITESSLTFAVCNAKFASVLREKNNIGIRDILQ